MKKVIDFIKEHNYLMILLIFIGFSISLSLTYSNFIVTSNNHKAAEMYIGELKYSIEIDGTTTNTLTVPVGETIIDVKVNNLNPVDTYYKLLYLKNTNITVKYYESTKDTDDVVTTYNKPNDSVASSNSNTIKLLITNNNESSQNVALTMKGGYITNTLSDITIPSTYSEITLIETPSTNTYFCKTNDTLTQGLKYVNGQYTYAYKQEGWYASSGIAWNNINNNGWGVQLTDKTSTDAVISKICTYISNKPITSISYMFSESKATTLDLSNFNTSNVTNMSRTFLSSQATTLDLSSFNTSKVIDMSHMFYGSKATSIDLSSFNTSNVTNMSLMFHSSQATTLDLSSFNTSKVTDMSHMFYGSKATSIDLSSFNTSNVTNMSWMFSGSQAIILNLNNFNTSKVTDMSHMFYGSKATSIDLSSFDTSNVTDMNFMFSGSQAATLDLSNFDTSNVVDMGTMFYNSKSTSIDLSSFDTSKVTDMSNMFNNSKATTLDLSNFDTSNVTNMQLMFSGSQVTTLDLSSFDISKVTDVRGMFKECQATVLDLSSFDTSNITSISLMFNNSTNLKTIYVSSKFNIDNITYSTDTFKNCTNLVGGSGTKYNSSYIDKTYAHIDGGEDNPGYFTDIADKPSTFPTDDWATIVSSVKAGNTNHYKVGDTKTIDLGTYGTHTIRVSNTTTSSECSTSGFSQTACGFVLEFADIITYHVMNEKANVNKGGWPASNMYTFVNTDIYNALPIDLKNGIIDTTVVSGHGENDTDNFTTIDKLYLLAPKEIYTDWSATTDTAKDTSRTLDYYNNLKVTTTNYSGAIKKGENNNYNLQWWWLRSATTHPDIFFFYVNRNGSSGVNSSGNESFGVSPAFRIG